MSQDNKDLVSYLLFSVVLTQQHKWYTGDI